METMGKWWFNQQTYRKIGIHGMGFNQLYLGANSSGACKHHSSPGWLKLCNKRSVLASTVDVCRIFSPNKQMIPEGLAMCPLISKLSFSLFFNRYINLQSWQNPLGSSFGQLRSELRSLFTHDFNKW